MTGYARSRAQRLVLFVKEKETEHSWQNGMHQALARSSSHADLRRVAFFLTEVRCGGGQPIRYVSYGFLSA